jgi:protein SCO1/2
MLLTKRILSPVALCLTFAFTALAQTAKPPAPPPASEMQGPHAGHQHGAQQEAPSAEQKYFSDVELLDQDGRKLRFYSDVLKGKTVVINAFFTTCTSVCPPMNRNMENVDWALYKVGQYVEDKQDHTTIFIVGNEATGLWKKAFGMAKPAELIQIVEGVANDKSGAK